MPAKTAKQYRAMQAASHGKSTLGISSMIGKEFVDKTPSSKKEKFAKSLSGYRKK